MPTGSSQLGPNLTASQRVTPPFPSLFWLIGPRRLVHPVYLSNIHDIWRFTLFWTLLVYIAAHLAVAIYAVVIVWWGSHGKRRGIGMGRYPVDSPSNPDGRQSMGAGETSRPQIEGDVKKPKETHGMKDTGISGMWTVPLFYALIAAIEAVFAGSIVGLLIGAVYQAGNFRMSTWIPFVWALVNLMILIISSFSLQGGL